MSQLPHYNMYVQAKQQPKNIQDKIQLHLVLHWDFHVVLHQDFYVDLHKLVVFVQNLQQYSLFVNDHFPLMQSYPKRENFINFHEIFVE